MKIPSASHTDHAASKGEELPQFVAVLAQLKHHEMAPLVSNIRRSMEILYDKDNSSNTVATWRGCRVAKEPLNGSFNLAYRILFDDGVEWILKIPANGHHACFDYLAAEALRSEALTMRLIKKRTTIPVPTVYNFDASFNNDIGCPYILMEFLKGKPLWEGWFDEDSSRSSAEQFRARSMQTIAAAMVQLSQFTVDSGGSLQFEPDGRPVGVTAARVSDWLAGSEIQQGLTTGREGCLYCEKGPINDPAASFLFMLDRRGVRDGDGPLELGSHEIVRMFTEWTLEKAENANDRRPKFVLAHPDFAPQNMLVEDDGTLCGIIDWDGVAAVPLSIGCLRYPDWLMSDWHPLYNYCPGVVGQLADSPEDSATYRTMYAQFVEASSTVIYGSSRAGKLNADITRRSLIAGSLDVGAQDPELTSKMIGIIFKRLERLTADHEDGEMLDKSLVSSIGTGTDDANEDDSGGDITPTEIEDSIRFDEKDENVASRCSKSTAELEPQSPPINVDDESNTSKPPTSHTTHSDETSLGHEHEMMLPSDGNYIEKKARDQKTSCSRKARLAKWALSLGERGSKMLVDSLHKKEPVKKSKPCRKDRAVKWALDLGEKCCKEASGIFHRKESPSNLQSKDTEQSLPVQDNFDLISTAVNPAAGTCKQIETPQSIFATHTDPDRVPINEESKPQKAMTKRIQAWVGWLIAMLKKLTLKPMIPKPIDDDVRDVQTLAMARKRLSSNFVLLNEQRQGCELPEIDQGGIPIDLIKKRREVIVQCVIQTLGNEIQQEKDTDSHTNEYDLTTLENIEEANRKLRINLARFEKSRGLGTKSCSESIQTIEAHRVPIDHTKAERYGKDLETSEADNQMLQNIQPSLKRPEVMTMDLQEEMIQVAGDADGFCESTDQSLRLATKSKVNGGSNVVSVQNSTKFTGGKWRESSKGLVRVQTPTKIKRGWWFETAGGSLKRTKPQEMLHGKAYDHEWTSSSQLELSDHQASKAVNTFQVPDDDDDDEDEDVSGYGTGGSTQHKNDRKDDRPEDGEIAGEVSACIENAAKTEGKEPTSRCSNEDMVKRRQKFGDDNYTGNFNPHDVCVALGKGKLDERRMRRLKDGFMALIDDAVGVYRRKL